MALREQLMTFGTSIYARGWHSQAFPGEIPLATGFSGRVVLFLRGLYLRALPQVDVPA